MYRLEHEGEAETKMYLERAVNYALGYVFDDALEAFKQRLTHDNAVRKSELVDEIIATLDDIIISGKHLKDADFKDAIALTYEWEGGKISTETWHANIKIILDKAE